MSTTDLHDDDLDLDEQLEPRNGETENELVKRLRGEIKTRDKELKRLRPIEAEVTETRLSKAMDTAFDKDEMAGLSDAKKAALQGAAGDDKSPEGLRKAAVELGFVEARIDPKEQELQGHERIEQASAGAAASAATKIDGSVVAEWSHEKKLRFMQQHPDAWESLKRGEPVTGIAF